MKKHFIVVLILFATVTTAVLLVNRGESEQGIESLSSSEQELVESKDVQSTQGQIWEPTQQPSTQEVQTTKEQPQTSLPPMVTEPPAPDFSGGNSSGTQEPEISSEPSTLPGIIKPREPITMPSQNNDLGLIERVIRAAGFLYDKEQNIFYSDTDPWQKNFGFTSVYDTFAKFGNMIYETERFKFSYGGRDWMFQVWKGRYGITSGAEMGIYYRDLGSDVDFYQCADASKYVAMDFKLYKDNELYMFREPTRHWWLTGFRLGDLIYGHEFLMEFTYYLDNAGMANALERAVVREGFVKDESYIRDGNSIRIFW